MEHIQITAMAVAEAIAMERERCAKIAADFRSYTGRGSENENTLIGMFARGNRNASNCIAAAIKHPADTEAAGQS